MKKLLIPLWGLVLISLVILAVLLFRGSPSTFLSSWVAEDEFYAWSIDKQIAAATVIARADWKLQNGVYKCIITEIVKQQSGTTFAFKVGDEFPRGNQRAQPGTTYGEGQVLFFTGSPPTLRHISVISEGRLIGLNDVSLETVREMILKKE